MQYDYCKLAGRIVEICGTARVFAQKMGLSSRAITQKMHNRNAWKQSEIERAIKVLKIPKTEIHRYFFKIKTQSVEEILEEGEM